MIATVYRTVFSRTCIALAAAACAAGAASAQQSSSVASQPVLAPALFASASTQPLELANLAGVSYSSSVSDGESTSAPATVDAERLNLSGDLSGNGTMQPPPRRYGRPRYNDSSHNSDGSNKYGFEAAVGLPLPIGDTHSYYNTSWAFQVGGGRNFNKNFAVNLQFDYDHLGVNANTLNNQATVYNTDYSAGITGLDANAHIWSFTVNPTYNFISGDKYGAYVVVGAGFYHKVTNFTAPQEGLIETYFGPETYVANANFDHYTSNAPGFNGGFGLTYKASRFAGERFFLEARYVFMDNSQRTGVTGATPYTVAQAYAGTDYFPANSNRTTYIPIKLGVRF